MGRRKTECLQGKARWTGVRWSRPERGNEGPRGESIDFPSWGTPSAGGVRARKIYILTRLDVRAHETDSRRAPSGRILVQVYCHREAELASGFVQTLTQIWSPLGLFMRPPLLQPFKTLASISTAMPFSFVLPTSPFPKTNSFLAVVRVAVGKTLGPLSATSQGRFQIAVKRERQAATEIVY